MAWETNEARAIPNFNIPDVDVPHVGASDVDVPNVPNGNSDDDGDVPGFSSGDVDCSLLTQAEAQGILAADPSDPYNLDGDGIPCEDDGSEESGNYQYSTAPLFTSGGPEDGPAPAKPSTNRYRPPERRARSGRPSGPRRLRARRLRKTEAYAGQRHGRT